MGATYGRSCGMGGAVPEGTSQGCGDGAAGGAVWTVIGGASVVGGATGVVVGRRTVVDVVDAGRVVAVARLLEVGCDAVERAGWCAAAVPVDPHAVSSALVARSAVAPMAQRGRVADDDGVLLLRTVPMGPSLIS